MNNTKRDEKVEAAKRNLEKATEKVQGTLSDVEKEAKKKRIFPLEELMSRIAGKPIRVTDK